MIYRVGLTGGLASGKSSVASRLRSHGIPVLDADQVVHDLYRPGRPGANAVAMVFGLQVIDSAGGVDRVKLGARVFSDPPALKTLNGLIHPLVLTEQARWFDAQTKSGEPLGVVEATLLVETGGRSRYDFIVTVSAPEAVRLNRALQRSSAEDFAAVARRIAAQISDAERETVADLVIVNDGTAEELEKKADSLAAWLLSAASGGEARP
jgi:dephospho-CoA kinase